MRDKLGVVRTKTPFMCHNSHQYAHAFAACIWGSPARFATRTRTENEKFPVRSGALPALFFVMAATQKARLYMTIKRASNVSRWRRLMSIFGDPHKARMKQGRSRKRRPCCQFFVRVADRLESFFGLPVMPAASRFLSSIGRPRVFCVSFWGSLAMIAKCRKRILGSNAKTRSDGKTINPFYVCRPAGERRNFRRVYFETEARRITLARTKNFAFIGGICPFALHKKGRLFLRNGARSW